MTEIHPTLLLLLVEAVAVLLLVQTVWLVLAWLRRRREHGAVRSLIAAMEKDGAARTQRNTAAMGSALSLKGEELAARVGKVEEAQKLLLKSVVLGWTKRDAGSVARLQEPVEALSACWREALAEAVGSSEPDAELLARVEELEREKAAIAAELTNSRDTMNRMLSEYAAMYQRGDREDDSTARRVLRGDAAHHNEPVPVAPDTEGDIEVERKSAGAAADQQGGSENLAATAESGTGYDPIDRELEMATADASSREDADLPLASPAASDHADPPRAGGDRPVRAVDRDDEADVQRIQDDLESLFDSADDLDFGKTLLHREDGALSDALDDEADDGARAASDRRGRNHGGGGKGQE